MAKVFDDPKAFNLVFGIIKGISNNFSIPNSQEIVMYSNFGRTKVENTRVNDVNLKEHEKELRKPLEDHFNFLIYVHGYFGSIKKIQTSKDRGNVKRKRFIKRKEIKILY